MKIDQLDSLTVPPMKPRVTAQASRELGVFFCAAPGVTALHEAATCSTMPQDDTAAGLPIKMRPQPCGLCLLPQYARQYQSPQVVTNPSANIAALLHALSFEVAAPCCAKPQLAVVRCSLGTPPQISSQACDSALNVVKCQITLPGTNEDAIYNIKHP